MGAAGSSGTCCWDTETIDGGQQWVSVGASSADGGQGQGEGGRRLCVKVPSACGHMAWTEARLVRAAETGVSRPFRGRPHSPEMSKGCPRAERVGQAEEPSLPFEAPENQKSQRKVSEVEEETLNGELLPACSSSSSSWAVAADTGWRVPYSEHPGTRVVWIWRHPVTLHHHSGLPNSQICNLEKSRI